ncbi:MAG: hypothetical protein HY049_06000 [Acidobacteria bacterium]|nr:hypothetical protein [Acidobacteriota bacterium]
MIADRELGEMQAAWRSGGARAGQASDLDALLSVAQARVRRESRRLVCVTFVEILLTAAMLAFAVLVARGESRAAVVAAAVATWVFAGWALGFSLWNRRGLWRPDAETTRGFVELSIRRCEAELRAVQFGHRLLVVESVFVAVLLGWKFTFGPVHSPVGSLVGVVALATLIFLVEAFLRRRGRRFEAELQEWRRFEAISGA